MSEIDHARWRKVIVKSQLIAVAFIFVVEVFINYYLYLRPGLDLSPEIIRQKITRYFILTTTVNVVTVILELMILREIDKNNPKQKYILILAFEIFCFNTCFSHYQISETYTAFFLPVLVCLLYEDHKLCGYAGAASLIGLIFFLVQRGLDPLYNEDIVVECVVECAVYAVINIFCHIVISILQEERKKVVKAESQSEKLRHTIEMDRKKSELMREREKLSTLTKETIMALSNAVEFNDHYTNGHSQRVANYSQGIARKMGLDPDVVMEVYYAGLLHDVGKIGIDNKIINKEGRLSDEEFRVLKTHPMKGYTLLYDISQNTEFKDLASGARWHHERMDGRGYPDGLTGDEIPLFARIIAVADSYDAMTSNRSYRSALPQTVVREEILSGLGTQFDAEIGRIMIEMIDEDIEYRMRQI